VVLAKQRFRLPRARSWRAVSHVRAVFRTYPHERSQHRERQVRKGAADAYPEARREPRKVFPKAILMTVQEVARRGSTPLLVSDGPRVLGS